MDTLKIKSYQNSGYIQKNSVCAQAIIHNLSLSKRDRSFLSVNDFNIIGH